MTGAGKSTFAELLGAPVFAADDYFMKNGKYMFDVNKLGAAHLDCQARTIKAMQMNSPRIVVANTFTTTKELKPYMDLAAKYNYRCFTVIVENRMKTKNVHDVPEEVLKKQADRFDIKLR